MQHCCISMSRTNQSKIDQLGIITSGLCAVHCAALPLMISLGLLGSIQEGTHGVIEAAVILTSAILGLWSIYNGLRGHGKLIPQLMIGGGALVIVFGLLVPAIGHPLMAIGGFVLLMGHWFNWRLLSPRKSQ